MRYYYCDIISSVIKGLRFNKIKSKGFMVYVFYCFDMSTFQGGGGGVVAKISLENYLKCVDLVVARPDISKDIFMDHFVFKIQINYSNVHIKLKIRTNVIYSPADNLNCCSNCDQSMKIGIDVLYYM